MEPLLGFTQPHANDTVSDQSHSLKFVPWISWDEWNFVRTSLFSSSPKSIASALQRITAWRSRGCLPVVVEVTASIVEIQQKDPFFRHDLPGKAVDSEEMLSMLYCMAIMRLVNGVIEKTRKKTEISIAEAAGTIGIPRMLIDIRHEGSHRDLPSLHLVRIASMKAIDWLKEYYWEPQKNAIPNQADVISNARVEIKHRLYDWASCLGAKRSLRSSSSLVKGKRFKHLEAFRGPNKFLSLMAVKHANSKSSVSKKQVNKQLKNVLRLYSSFSGEVVDILLELLLKSVDLSNKVDLSENQEISHKSETTTTELDAWKPIVIKLLKKEPGLFWSLLKVVLEKIENKGANSNEIVDRLSADHVDGSHHIEQLASVFEWLVRNLSAVKPLEVKNSVDEGKDFLTEKNHPDATIFELLRKCLVASSHGHLQLMTSATVLARMIGDRLLISKLEKLLSLTVMDLDVGEAFPMNDSSSESFLSHEQESIDFAARSLELIKVHRRKTETLMPKNSNEKSKRWVIVKSWTPCPIGMLPHSPGSAGRLPVLECNSETHEIPTLPIRKDQQESNECSEKGELDSVNDSDNMNAKKIRKTSECCEMDDQENLTSDDIKGHMIIGGVWKKVREEELLAIASAVKILV